MMKKILVISPFNTFPPYWGGASRIYNLVKHFSRNNRVLLLFNDIQKLSRTETADEHIIKNENLQLYSVRAATKWAQIINPMLVIKGFKLIRREKPSFILAEVVWSGPHAIILHFLTGVPYILDEHNVECIRFQRMGRGGYLVFFFLRIFEYVSCSFAQRVLCVSEDDKQFLVTKLKIKTDKILVVPNGVDTNECSQNEMGRHDIRKRLNISDDDPVILFFGKLDCKPNTEAAHIIHSELLPRIIKKMPNTKFLIIGYKPPTGLEHQNMILTGVVDKITDYIGASDLVVCPLLSGGGTRIKILESIACGKVVISTTMGAEGIDRSICGDRLVISDDWQGFSERIIHLIENPKQDYVPPEFIAKYSWENIINNVIQ